MSIQKRIKRVILRISPRLAEKLTLFWGQLAPLWSGRMTFRNSVKYAVFGLCPGFRGRFRCYNTTIYFPNGSGIFLRACEQGVYEAEVADCLSRLAKPGSTYFDVGANIGLTSIPVLRAVPDVRVVSFEPSPNSVRYLERTRKESDFCGRWEIVPKAAGEATGIVRFCAADSANGGYDGLLDTRRGGEKRIIEVPQTSVDAEWIRLGRPLVSCMKIDVEGAESKVLMGSSELLEQQRPGLVVEWNHENLAPYGTAAGFLVEFANAHQYDILALPNRFPVPTIKILEQCMRETESFLLVSKKGAEDLSCSSSAR
jgi:FkbM family methyltransferase